MYLCLANPASKDLKMLVFWQQLRLRLGFGVGLGLRAGQLLDEDNDNEDIVAGTVEFWARGKKFTHISKTALERAWKYFFYFWRNVETSN